MAFFFIQNLQTDPSRGNVCKSYNTDRRNHHQYRVHISRPGVHESRKTHTHTCAHTRTPHARTHTHTRTPKILIYRVPPRANRVPRVSTVSTPGLINDRWRNGTEYQRRRRPSALHGSRRWDRSATLNRSGVIEAIYTRPMRFHGREREGVTGRDRERKKERERNKEKEREKERERKRGKERERRFTSDQPRHAARFTAETTDRSRTYLRWAGRAPRRRVGGRQIGARIQLGTTKLARFDTRDHGVCARAEPRHEPVRRKPSSRRERVCERPERGPISLEGTSIAPFP